MNDQPVQLDEIVGVIRRHLGTVLVWMLLGAILAGIAASYLPKRYKSRSVLTIQSTYFRNPLVSDLVSETHDSTELNAQRVSLLRLALDDGFLDRLGTRYGAFRSEPGTERRVEERSDLLKRIEYISLSPTSFQISIMAESPRLAWEMTRDVLGQMTWTLIEQRLKTLVRARDAIGAQVRFLSRTIGILEGPGAAAQPEYLQRELSRLDDQIAALQRKFTEHHPQLARLRERADSVRTLLEEQRSRAGELPEDDLARAFITPSSKTPVQEIYNDLLKKLSHMSIVLEMERDRENVSYLAVIEKPSLPTQPVFPNPHIFVAGGAGLGLIFACLLAGWAELQRARLMRPDHAAAVLGVPLLGALPAVERDNSPALAPPRRERELPLLEQE